LKPVENSLFLPSIKRPWSRPQEKDRPSEMYSDPGFLFFSGSSIKGSRTVSSFGCPGYLFIVSN
jgi:hypothetical protein